MFPSKEIVERVRKEYPVGARVELLRMDDPQAPPVGTLGTVEGVDDTASIMVRWDNGCGLNVVYGQDWCRVITPDAPPGSTLTMILEDGEWKRVGPVPKIDVSQIPKHALDSLCRTLLDSVQEYFKDPEHVKAFEEWKKNREKDTSKNEKNHNIHHSVGKTLCILWLGIDLLYLHFRANMSLPQGKHTKTKRRDIP